MRTTRFQTPTVSDTWNNDKLSERSTRHPIDIQWTFVRKPTFTWVGSWWNQCLQWKPCGQLKRWSFKWRAGRWHSVTEAKWTICPSIFNTRPDEWMRNEWPETPPVGSAKKKMAAVQKYLIYFLFLTLRLLIIIGSHDSKYFFLKSCLVLNSDFYWSWLKFIVPNLLNFLEI